MDIDSLVFLDESSIDTGMTRLYGRAASNERVTDYTPIPGWSVPLFCHPSVSNILGWFAEDGYSTQ
jgi:uncharacterized membrane protein